MDSASQIVENLYDLNHKGRLLAMFRHPVQRLVSKFFYLRLVRDRLSLLQGISLTPCAHFAHLPRVAKWESNYEPSWKDISIETWALKFDRDRNFLVRFHLSLRLQRSRFCDSPFTKVRTLAGKTIKEVDQADLQVAKRTIAQRFIVGLSEEYDESLRRFGIMLNFKSKTTIQDRYGLLI